MRTSTPPRIRPAAFPTRPTARDLVAPGGLTAAAAHVCDVLAFQAANGGPYPGSLELEYAVRRLARAALHCALAPAALAGWLRGVVLVAFGASPIVEAVAARAIAWAADEAAEAAGNLGGANAASA